MGAFAIIKANPIADDALSCVTVVHFMQIYCLIFERTPEPFDKDVVKVTPATIHGDDDARSFQTARKG